MKSRRDFLKEAATGAVLLGSKGAFALTGTTSDEHEGTAKSKVVIARDPALLILDEPTTGLDVTVEAEVPKITHQPNALPITNAR